MSRHVRVTVSHRPARPWWVLPVPHVHGFLGMAVFIFWLELAACWYTLVLGGFLLYYAAQGVMMTAALITSLLAAHRAKQPQPQPETKPEPEWHWQPSHTHDSVVERLPESVRPDFR